MIIHSKSICVKCSKIYETMAGNKLCTFSCKLLSKMKEWKENIEVDKRSIVRCPYLLEHIVLEEGDKK